ncbi:hypothetical protein BDF14DRAFT_249435 [Spinellus fusiger]|nr:hypothetical protein BDF14DRAFT_249435 [Spinellus fusiger]
MDQDSCIICFESFSTAAISALFCRHTFHHHCLMSWVENGANRCPICNHTFVKSAIIGPLFVAFEKYDPNMGAIAKKERLELEELVSQKEDMRLELLALDGLINQSSRSSRWRQCMEKED